MLDNEYFEINAYYYQNNTLNKNNKIDLKICEDSDLKFKTNQKGNKKYYNSPICIKDRDTFQLKSNWFHDDYTVPFITISYCSKDPKKCKQKNETRDFLRKHPFYMIF